AFAHAAVGGPSGVADPDAAARDPLGDPSLEVAHPLGRADRREHAVVLPDGDARRVVSAVLEQAESVDERSGNGIPGADRDDAAHQTCSAIARAVPDPARATPASRSDAATWRIISSMPV